MFLFTLSFNGIDENFDFSVRYKSAGTGVFVEDLTALERLRYPEERISSFTALFRPEFADEVSLHPVAAASSREEDPANPAESALFLIKTLRFIGVDS